MTSPITKYIDEEWEICKETYFEGKYIKLQKRDYKNRTTASLYHCNQFIASKEEEIKCKYTSNRSDHMQKHALTSKHLDWNERKEGMEILFSRLKINEGNL